MISRPKAPIRSIYIIITARNLEASAVDISATSHFLARLSAVYIHREILACYRGAVLILVIGKMSSFITKRSMPQNISSSKRICFSSEDVECRLTVESLPSNMFHLGGENFAIVSQFLGMTRVHVRRYKADNQGTLFPTKEGVSLSPLVWHEFSKQLKIFTDWKDADNATVIKKDLCVSAERICGKPQVALQRLFRKKDSGFCFVPERVVLDMDHIRVLDSKVDDVCSVIKKSLLCYTLEYFTKKEIGDHSQLNENCLGDPDRPEGLHELSTCLSKCLKKIIALKISELFVCFGCEEGYENQLGHECLTMTLDEKFAFYFDVAFYTIDWRKLAKDFVQENASNINFHKLIFVDDFFDILDINYVFKTVEELYVNENNILFQSLLSICV